MLRIIFVITLFTTSYLDVFLRCGIFLSRSKTTENDIQRLHLLRKRMHIDKNPDVHEYNKGKCKVNVVTIENIFK